MLKELFAQLTTPLNLFLLAILGMILFFGALGTWSASNKSRR